MLGLMGQPLPSPEREPERYAGKPLFILIENYVLSVLGQLDADMNARVEEIVRRVYGGGVDWRCTLREQLDLNQTVDESIFRMWKRNCEIALQQGVTLHPVQFAKMFADRNFSDLLPDANGDEP